MEKQIADTVAQAKAKMAKGDKKGEYVFSVLLLCLSRYFCFCFKNSISLAFPFSKIQFYSNIIYSLGALYAMKRKKIYEAEIDKIQNVRMTLETQVINLESAAQNAQTYQALSQGSKTMQKIRTDVGIEQVDDVMDEIKEEMELAQEINQAIAQPVDPFMTDEDELLDELNALETADLEAELLKAPAAKTEEFALPDAPSETLPALAKSEEDDLKQLEAELAGL